MAGFDAVFVGSGINSLAGAALLAKDGWRVCVLERNDWLGGAIKTVDGLTAPGFRHEVFSSWHPLWVGSPAYAELKPDLDRLGLEYLNTDLPTATAFPDGSSAHLSTDGAANVAELGDAWQRAVRRVHGGGRHRLRRRSAPSSGRRRASRSAAGPTSSSGGAGSSSSPGTRCSPRATGSHDTFPDERAHGLLAPWVLHTGLGPDQAMSGFMTQVIACALQLGGMPVPKGGGAQPRRRARGDRARRRRRAAHRGRGRADRRLGGQGDRGPAGGRRDGRGLARRARLRHADAALRPPARRERRAGEDPRAGAPLPLRPRRDADPHRHERAAALARRRAARAHAARSTSPPASTASRAPSTRPTAACSRPRRRSRSVSRWPSIPRARRTARG